MLSVKKGNYDKSLRIKSWTELSITRLTVSNHVRGEEIEIEFIHYD